MKQLATVVAGLATLVLATAASALAAGTDTPGAVYALTNATQGNAVAVYDRSADGGLSSPRLYPTLGLGNGTGLGSQGGLALTENGKVLLAVNPASDSISAFEVDKQGPRLLGVVPSYGTSPISIAVRKHVAYVLNGASRSIQGYSIDNTGLAPILGSARGLSGSASTPSEIAFAPNGALLVTERGSNTIDSFTLDDESIPEAPKQTAAVGNVPFGFDFAKGYAIVSDADAGAGNSAATAYSVAGDGTLAAVSGPVTTGQAAACWLVTSKDGRFAFTANAGSGSISALTVGADGALLDVHTTVVLAGAHVVDEAVSGNGRFLYVLADRAGQVFGFRIEDDGSLTSLGSVGGLAPGGAALVAS